MVGWIVGKSIISLRVFGWLNSRCNPNVSDIFILLFFSLLCVEWSGWRGCISSNTSMSIFPLPRVLLGGGGRGGNGSRMSKSSAGSFVEAGKR